MVPALHPGERLWVSAVPAAALRRGSIILLKRPSEPEGFFLKRLIGFPGERVLVRNARVFINGEPLSEGYVDPRAALEPKPDAAWTLGPDEYIVLGDARDDSLDSRRWGPVRVREIAGRVAFRLWPLKKMP